MDALCPFIHWQKLGYEILLAKKNIDLRKNRSYVNIIKIDYSGYQLCVCEISNQVSFSPTSFSQIENAEVLDSFFTDRGN